MCKVYSKKDRNVPRSAVYVGRGSPFGNPFVMGPAGDRDAVCDKFEAMARAKPGFMAKIERELAGKDLVCFCAPLRCHADFLLQIANGLENRPWNMV